MEEKATARGELKIYVRKVSEPWHLHDHVKNLTVNLGLNLIRDNLFQSQTDYIQWGAVSDNTAAVAAADTSLGGNEVRTTFESGYPDVGTDFQATVQFLISTTDWANASPSAMSTATKAGLYYQASGSTLYCGALFTSVNVDSDTEMLLEWKVVYADA